MYLVTTNRAKMSHNRIFVLTTLCSLLSEL